MKATSDTICTIVPQNVNSTAAFKLPNLYAPPPPPPPHTHDQLQAHQPVNKKLHLIRLPWYKPRPPHPSSDISLLQMYWNEFDLFWSFEVWLKTSKK